MIQSRFAQGIWVSCGSQTFGIGNAEFTFRVSAEPAKRTGLNNPAADGKLSSSKLLRRINLEGIQRISGSALTNQSFCPENAKLVVPNRVCALRSLETLVR